MEEWRRNQYLLALAVFISVLGGASIIAFIPLYIHNLGVRDFKEVAVWSGTVLGILRLSSGIMNPLGGMMADKYGCKLMMGYLFLGLVIIMALMGFATNIFQFLILSAALGFSGAFTTVSMVMIIRLTPVGKSTEGLGMMRVGQILGLAMGPAIGGILADIVGLRAIFFVAAAMGLLSLVLLGCVSYEEGEQVRSLSKSLVGQALWRDMAGWSALIPFLAVLLLSQFVEKSLGLLVPLYVGLLATHPQSVGRSVGLVISSMQVAMAVSAGLVGRVCGLFSSEKMCLIGLVSAAIFYLLLAFARALWQLLGLCVLIGLAIGGVVTLVYVMGASTVPVRKSGGTLGLLVGVGNIGGAFGSLLTGGVAAFNLGGAFVFDSMLCVVAVLCLLTALKRERCA